MSSAATEAAVRLPTEPLAAPTQDRRFDLFLVSFLLLFLELSSIRWFGSTVVFLTFFTNLVLMASFLGMYNYYRQGWIVGRAEKTIEKVFGTKPVVIALPYTDEITPGGSTAGSVTFLIAGKPGCKALEAVRAKFQEIARQPAAGRRFRLEYRRGDPGGIVREPVAGPGVQPPDPGGGRVLRALGAPAAAGRRPGADAAGGGVTDNGRIAELDGRILAAPGARQHQ
ncbi:MAG: hypothetical protein ACLQIB_29485 [Isosphaeraceae bacterium]